MNINTHIYFQNNSNMVDAPVQNPPRNVLIVGDSRLNGFQPLLNLVLPKYGINPFVLYQPGATLEWIADIARTEIHNHGNYDLCLLSGGICNITNRSFVGNVPVYTFNHQDRKSCTDYLSPLLAKICHSLQSPPTAQMTGLIHIYGTDLAMANKVTDGSIDPMQDDLWGVMKDINCEIARYNTAIGVPGIRWDNIFHNRDAKVESDHKFYLTRDGIHALDSIKPKMARLVTLKVLEYFGFNISAQELNDIDTAYGLNPARGTKPKTSTRKRSRSKKH